MLVRLNPVMIAALSLLAIAAVCIYYRENLIIEVVEVNVPIHGLPAAFDGFRIAQLSDLHGRKLNEGWIEEQLTAAGLDMIALTGDYVRHNNSSDMSRLAPLLATVPQIAPTFAVSGNHDIAAGWASIAAELRQHGVTVLDNAYTTIARGDARLALAGLACPYDSLANLSRAIPADAGPVILLTHSPQVYTQHLAVDYLGEPLIGHPNVAAWANLIERPALTLAGHTHGGQVKLPFIGAVTTATGQLFPSKHIEGLSWEGSGWLYISRGLGYTGLPLRFLSRPELTIITLKQAE